MKPFDRFTRTIPSSYRGTRLLNICNMLWRTTDPDMIIKVMMWCVKLLVDRKIDPHQFLPRRKLESGHKTLPQLKKEKLALIKAALDKTGGDVAEAAAILDVPVRTLRSEMNRNSLKV